MSPPNVVTIHRSTWGSTLLTSKVHAPFLDMVTQPSPSMYAARYAKSVGVGPGASETCLSFEGAIESEICSTLR